MACKTDSLDDWITGTHEEHGTKFYVVHRKDDTSTKPLSQTGPYESLNREGRYLVPYNWLNGTTTLHFQTAAMFAAQREQLRFRPGDVVIASYPRSGTTWLEQCVALIRSKGDDAGLSAANKNTYDPRVPHRFGKIVLEVTMHGRSEDVASPWGTVCGQDVPITQAEFDDIPFRRLLKTHARPYQLIGFGPAAEQLARKEPPPMDVPDVKFMCMVRDPKDVAASLYHVNVVNLEKVGMPFTAFVKLFLEGKTIVSGHWTTYTKEWLNWASSFPDNFLVMTYEENRARPEDAIRKIASFLGESLTDAQVRDCVEKSSFERMKEQSKSSTAEHVHHGTVGAGRGKMTPDMLKAFNAILSDPQLGSYGTRYITPVSSSQPTCSLTNSSVDLQDGCSAPAKRPQGLRS